jgi:hypothetical protein
MMVDAEVEDVRIIRMKNMGPQGDKGFVVEVKQESRWTKILEDGTRGEAERVAADARRRVPTTPRSQN